MYRCHLSSVFIWRNVIHRCIKTQFPSERKEDMTKVVCTPSLSHTLATNRCHQILTKNSSSRHYLHPSLLAPLSSRSIDFLLKSIAWINSQGGKGAGSRDAEPWAPCRLRQDVLLLLLPLLLLYLFVGVCTVMLGVTSWVYSTYKLYLPSNTTTHITTQVLSRGGEEENYEVEWMSRDEEYEGTSWRNTFILNLYLRVRSRLHLRLQLWMARLGQYSSHFKALDLLGVCVCVCVCACVVR